MNIAILGATSQIAKDLIVSFVKRTDHHCILFSRDASVVQSWLLSSGIGCRYESKVYAEFTHGDYDTIINFVGVGDPALAIEMGALIFDITYQYDQLALDYVKLHPECKYIFLSSGAVYGNVFDNPVDENSHAKLAINALKPRSYYGVAKLYAEARHRALPELSIVDVRVFNYFSHAQDMDASFLITELVRAIRKKDVFKTSTHNIVRDFITPPDFYNLVDSILKSPPRNIPVDCYTKEPVSKLDLLKELVKKFELNYELVEVVDTVNATGEKMNYYSKKRTAAEFGYMPRCSSMSGIVEQIGLGEG